MSISALSTNATISLTQGAVSASSVANSDAQAAPSSTSNSSTTASSVAAATVAPASASPVDAIAQQLAQYTTILDDSTGAYSIDQQVQAYDAVGTILFGTVVGTGSSAHFDKTTTLSSSDVQAAFYAADESKFGLQVQAAYQGISKAELGSDAGGAPSDSQDPNKALLNGFESLSATDQKIYLDTAGRGAYEGWSSADFESNLQASSNLENYINEATKTEKLTSDEIFNGNIADPTLKAAYALQASGNTLGFADAVNSLLGSPDSANSVSAKAAAAYAPPGSSTAAADTSITEGKKALASLASAPTAVTDASVALTVLQNAAAKSEAATKTSADLKSGSAPTNLGHDTSALGLTSSGTWPYTKGSIASATA